MVTALLPAVLALLFVPVHPEICQPVAGAAPLKLIFAPATYWPVAQPVELDGEAVGFVPCPL
jgi:hypothetical protein